MVLFKPTNAITINNLNQKWLAAKSAWEAFGSMSVTCIFCHKKYSSSSCRIFHTIPPNKGMADVEDGVSSLKDHIVVCPSCRYYIDNTWTGCRCKNKNKKPLMYL